MTIEAYQPSPLSQISHELRIPLTTIKGMIYWLNSTPLDAQQKECLHIIEDAADKLLSLENKLHIVMN